ncbi:MULTISPECIES: hypothetical protein [Ramlibacter]|uniref:Uncharacterized protein n=1 Tax=Ramlibacter pinisoli TaxID=2682844 RepID=A0A6N8IZZ3_9BURK|nr:MULTISPECIES: hypothetical protein [Ramlibacter]MBA2962222.1 hypothetical protein [Ramlibacter sp. CGMCC 1.13660]MVQ32165.1 hypothetical protein [Ramlibacter pinisoli]
MSATEPSTPSDFDSLRGREEDLPLAAWRRSMRRLADLKALRENILAVPDVAARHPEMLEDLARLIATEDARAAQLVKQLSG